METSTLTPIGVRAAFRALAFASVLTLVAVVATTLLGAMLDGSRAAGAAALGGGGVLFVSVFGIASLTLVIWAMSRLALLIAMMTYVLQVFVLLTAFSAWQDRPELARDLSSGWLATGIVVAAFVWMVGYVITAFRTRHAPAMPWPSAPTGGPSQGAPEAGAQ